MGFVNDLSHRARQSRSVRYGIMGALALGSGDYVPYEGETLKQSMRLLGAESWGVNAVKSFGRTYSSSIDPRLDSMAPEQILAAGAAHVGSRPSPFVSNPDIITPEDWKQLHKLTEQKLLSEGELHSFVNLLGVAHKEQAQAALSYTLEPSAQNRMRVANSNLDMAEIPFSIVMQIFGRNKDLRQQAEHGLTFDHLRAAFPHATKVGRAVQMIDDQTDLALDALTEKKTGRPSTNFVLAKAHEAGDLTDASGQINALTLTRMEKLLNASQIIPVSTLPQSMRAGLHAAGQDFHDISSEMNLPVRKLLDRAWNHSMKRGLVQADNDRMHTPSGSMGR